MAQWLGILPCEENEIFRSRIDEQAHWPRVDLKFDDDSRQSGLEASHPVRDATRAEEDLPGAVIDAEVFMAEHVQAYDSVNAKAQRFFGERQVRDQSLYAGGAHGADTHIRKHYTLGAHLAAEYRERLAIAGEAELAGNPRIDHRRQSAGVDDEV